MGRQRPTRSMRQFQSPAWEGVRQNYPSSTRTRIDALVADGAPNGAGRLLLWHGPPGTGKTSAVLGLSQVAQGIPGGVVLGGVEARDVAAELIVLPGPLTDLRKVGSEVAGHWTRIHRAATREESSCSSRPAPRATSQLCTVRSPSLNLKNSRTVMSPAGWCTNTESRLRTLSNAAVCSSHDPLATCSGAVPSRSPSSPSKAATAELPLRSRTANRFPATT